MSISLEARDGLAFGKVSGTGTCAGPSAGRRQALKFEQTGLDWLHGRRGEAKRRPRPLEFVMRCDVLELMVGKCQGEFCSGIDGGIREPPHLMHSL